MTTMPSTGTRTRNQPGILKNKTSPLGSFPSILPINRRAFQWFCFFMWSRGLPLYSLLLRSNISFPLELEYSNKSDIYHWYYQSGRMIVRYSPLFAVEIPCRLYSSPKDRSAFRNGFIFLSQKQFCSGLRNVYSALANVSSSLKKDTSCLIMWQNGYSLDSRTWHRTRPTSLPASGWDWRDNQVCFDLIANKWVFYWT